MFHLEIKIKIKIKIKVCFQKTVSRIRNMNKRRVLKACHLLDMEGAE